jgi:hypothetical protein
MYVNSVIFRDLSYHARDGWKSVLAKCEITTNIILHDAIPRALRNRILSIAQKHISY